MAGDWLKFETNTPEKQEVLAITLELGYDDPDLTVGKLLKVWRWFDQHTVDGNAESVTPALLDRLIGVTGITMAMANVGWIIIKEGGLTLPNFARHNGKTAKARILTALRVANYKDKEKGNAASVTLALPREEKRREDKNIKTLTPDGFELFWNAYDKKIGKPNAIKQWIKLNPSAELINLIVAKAQADATAKPDTKFRKDPERWIKGRHWEDEVIVAMPLKRTELPLGSDEQIEYAYKVECGGDPRVSRFNSYFDMKKYILDQREKRESISL